MTVVRNLIVRAGADFSSLRNEMRRAQKNISEFRSGVEGAVRGIGMALGGIAIGSYVSDAVRSAMDVEAAMQQINRLMGEHSAAFKNWADESATAFNMSSANAIKYGAIFGNLLSTFSSGAEDTKNKTIEILKASAVTASATGRTMEDVMWRIRSGLLGNTEAIEDLGINVYVNMLKSTKAFQMFAGDKSWDQLDFQTQQLIRYYGILEQANKKFGAEVNVNTNSALQGFQAALGNVKLALGQAFLPILNRVLPILTAMANALYRVMSIFSQFMRALFGYKDPAMNVSKTSTQAAGAIGGMADAYDAAGAAADSAGSKAKKAAKAAKEAQRGVAGFDEINEVSETKASAGGSGAGGGAGAGGGTPFADIPMPDPGMTSAMEAISDKVQKFADRVRGVFSALKNFVQSNKDIIIAALAGIGAGLATAFVATRYTKGISLLQGAILKLAAAAGVAWRALTGPIGLAALAIGAAVAAAVYFYRTNEKFRGFVDSIFKAIKDAAIQLWEKALVPLGNWLKQSFVKAWEAAGKAGDWLWKNVMVPLGDYLKRFYNEALIPLANALKGPLAAAWDIVTSVAKEFWKNVMVPLGDFLKANFKPTIDLLMTVLKPLAALVGEGLILAFKGLASTISALWNNVLKPMVPYVKDTVANAFKHVGEVIGGLKTAFNGIITFLTGVFTGNWSKAWNGVKDIFKGVFESLYGIVKLPLNLIIDAINAVISGINSLDIKVPDWVPKFGGRTYSPNIPRIPRLARGGIVDGKTNMGNYIAGESGAEMIVPLENTSFTDKIASALGTAVMNAMTVSGSGSGNKGDVILQVDGTTLARVLKPYLAKEGTRVGGSSIVAR